MVPGRPNWPTVACFGKTYFFAYVRVLSQMNTRVAVEGFVQPKFSVCHPYVIKRLRELVCVVRLLARKRYH